MEIAIVIEGISKKRIARQPWIYYKDALAKRNINILVYRGNGEAFQRSFDAMLLHVWQDWRNKERFIQKRLQKIFGGYTGFSEK